MRFSISGILFGLLCCILLIIAEQTFEVSYSIKTIIKFILFFVIPFQIMYHWHSAHPSTLVSGKRPESSILSLSLSLGIGCITLTLLAYALIGDVVNWNLIVDDVQNRLGVTPAVFPFVALYITFGNSFLEEWFFRGFLHLKLISFIGHWKASIFSAALFSIYHLAMVVSWFDWPVLLLCMAALFAVGMVFNQLNRKQENIFASWIVHILADIGVMIVGFFIFY